MCTHTGSWHGVRQWQLRCVWVEAGILSQCGAVCCLRCHGMPLKLICSLFSVNFFRRKCAGPISSEISDSIEHFFYNRTLNRVIQF